MLSLEERERLTEIQDQLMELYVLRRYAVEDGDERRTQTINKEIAASERERQSLRQGIWSEPPERESATMDQNATKRRHVRDKSVIDHLARELYHSKPEPASEKTTGPSGTTDTGLSVEDQVRKEWDPKKGGLPTF
jgi:hypothetical protein